MSRSRCEPRSTSSTDAGEPIAGEHGGDRGADDLAAVGDGEDPRHPIEGGTEVVAVARLGGARVERHPDPQRAGLVPGRIAQRTLGGDRRVDGRDGVGEDRQHPVAGRLDHAPAHARRCSRGGADRAGRAPAPIRSACSSQRRVLPSMSVNRKVETALSASVGPADAAATRRPSLSRAGKKGWAASGNATAARCSQRRRCSPVPGPQPRPIVVAMSASLPAASASVHHDGANWSRTMRPPAASAAATRASA